MKNIKIKKSFVYLFAFFIFLFSSCNQLVSSLNNTSQPENSSLVNKSDNCSVTINLLSANSGERSIGSAETFTPSDGNPSLDLEITPVIDSTLGNGYYSYNFIFPSSSLVDFYKVCYKMDTSQTFSEETSVENGGTFTMTNVGGAGISAGKHSFSLKVESYSFVYASTTTSATLNLTTQYAGQEIISSLTPTISSTDSSGQQTLVYIVGSGTYTFTVLSPDKLSQTVYTFTGVSS